MKYFSFHISKQTKKSYLSLIPWQNLFVQNMMKLLQPCSENAIRLHNFWRPRSREGKWSVIIFPSLSVSNSSLFQAYYFNIFAVPATSRFLPWAWWPHWWVWPLHSDVAWSGLRFPCLSYPWNKQKSWSSYLFEMNITQLTRDSPEVVQFFLFHVKAVKVWTSFTFGSS